jgi:glyoxylase-like metal-dependent hydrolase (beta-lactamase superfamily II)
MERKIDNIYIKRFLYFNLYVIKGKNGDILIDTGFIGMKRALKRWLDKFNIKLVILTHAHVDHTWNAAYIKNLYKCKLALSKDDIENIDNRNIKSTPSTNKHKNWTKLMNYGMKKFIPKEYKVDLKLNNNQTIKKYGLDLKIVSLPGHTDGSIGVLYKDYLFAGDALVNRKKQPQIAYQNQHNKKALSSFQKIMELAPKIIFVGHDKIITKI